MKAGGLTGAVFIAAKEIALDGFIAGAIGFLDMAGIVEDVMTQMSSAAGHIDAAITLDNVAQCDHLARIRASEAIAAQRKRG